MHPSPQPPRGSINSCHESLSPARGHSTFPPPGIPSAPLLQLLPLAKLHMGVYPCQETFSEYTLKDCPLAPQHLDGHTITLTFASLSPWFTSQLLSQDVFTQCISCFPFPGCAPSAPMHVHRNTGLTSGLFPPLSPASRIYLNASSQHIAALNK